MTSRLMPTEAFLDALGGLLLDIGKRHDLETLSLNVRVDQGTFYACAHRGGVAHITQECFLERASEAVADAVQQVPAPLTPEAVNG
jgi:hypothetical protein